MIICIGDGGSTSDQQAQKIALERNLEYHGVLDSSTVLQPGVYHTSIIDITPQELVDISSDDVEYIILDGADISLINASGNNSILNYMETNKSFCGLAFTSILQDQNKYRFCCYQNTPLTVTDDFDFATNPELQKIRSKMIRGETVKQCSHCTRAEQQNRTPIRKIKTSQTAHTIGVESIDDLISFNRSVDYDIRVGNQCNALCRMCDPDNSHLIDQEYYKLGVTNKTLGTVPSTTFELVDIPTAKRVYVAGGEPSINKEFIGFLTNCVEQKHTDFLLEINTNAFVLPNKFIELLKNFSNIRFIISVDGYSDALYYIRYPILWEKLIANIETLNSIGDICFNHTISIYNVGRMYEMFKYFNDYYPTKTKVINYVDNPECMWFGNHPNKEVVLDQVQLCKNITEYKTNINFHKDIDHIENTIKTHKLNYDLLDKFYKFNDLLDNSRGTQLIDYMPELAEKRKSDERYRNNHSNQN